VFPIHASILNTAATATFPAGLRMKMSKTVSSNRKNASQIYRYDRNAKVSKRCRIIFIHIDLFNYILSIIYRATVDV
jgi:hypothetical protein